MDKDERADVGFINRPEEHTENIASGRENIGPLRLRFVVLAEPQAKC